MLALRRAQWVFGGFQWVQLRGDICKELARLGDDGWGDLWDILRGRFDRRNSAISFPVLVRVRSECKNKLEKWVSRRRRKDSRETLLFIQVNPANLKSPNQAFIDTICPPSGPFKLVQKAYEPHTRTGRPMYVRAEEPVHASNRSRTMSSGSHQRCWSIIVKELISGRGPKV